MQTQAAPPPQTTPVVNRSTSPSSAGAKLCDLYERHEASGLFVVLLSVFLISLWLSHHRRLWFDELFTLLLALQPTWHDFRLAMPAEGNPPLLAGMVHELIRLLGPTALAARLPSMLAFVAACGGVYIFVRRRSRPVVGLLAISFVLAQPAWSYSVESRPYALLLAFLMLTLVSYQTATSTGDRRRALAGMAIGIAGAVFSHHIGIVTVGLPLLLGEVVRLTRTRKPDWALYGVCMAAGSLLALTYPMANRTRSELLGVFTSHKTPLSVHVVLDWLRGIRFNLPTLLSVTILGGVALLIAFTWPSQSWRIANSRILPHLPPHELAAALGTALLIPVTLFTVMFTSSYYNIRYGIGSVLGLAILAALFLASCLPERADIMALLIFTFCMLFVQDARTRASWPPPEMPTIPAQYADQYVVLNNPFYFYPLWWYGTPEQRDHLHFVFDPETALADNNAVPESSLMLERGRFPAHLDRYDEFVASHTRFVAFVPNGLGDAIKAHYLRSGFQLTPIGADGQLLEVTRPEASRPGIAP